MSNTKRVLGEMFGKLVEEFRTFKWDDYVAMACCGAFMFDPDDTEWDGVFNFWPGLYVE